MIDDLMRKIDKSYLDLPCNKKTNHLKLSEVIELCEDHYNKTDIYELLVDFILDLPYSRQEELRHLLEENFLQD